MLPASHYNDENIDLWWKLEENLDDNNIFNAKQVVMIMNQIGTITMMKRDDKWMKRKKKKKKVWIKNYSFWSLGPKSKLTLSCHNKTHQVQSISASSQSHQKELKTINSVAANIKGYHRSNIPVIWFFSSVPLDCFVNILQTLAEIGPTNISSWAFLQCSQLSIV